MKELFLACLNAGLLHCKCAPELIKKYLCGLFGHKIIVRWREESDLHCIIYTFHQRPSEDDALLQMPVQIVTWLSEKGVITKIDVQEDKSHGKED